MPPDPLPAPTAAPPLQPVVDESMPALSVLDFAPMRTDQTSADAIAATVALARLADDLGYQRYWVAEHHASPAASTHPPTLIGVLAAQTRRIRVGSGGVMLPNHTAFDVAEQFTLLESAFPGRIDMGIGRAPGGEAVAAYVLRDGQVGDAGQRFPQDLQDLTAMVRPEGAALRVQGRSFTLKATPRLVSAPPVWLLGSSSSSARLAAETGMPYVYAHHFFGSGTDEALDVYRSHFQPSEHAEEPTVLLTVNAVVADTDDDARRLALPYVLEMLDLQMGRSLSPQPLVEEAETRGLPPGADEAIARILAPWAIGTAEQARAQVRALAARHGVAEIMVHPITGTFSGATHDRSPQRENTLRLLAEG